MCPVYVSEFSGSALLDNLYNRFVVFCNNEFHLRAILSGKIEVLDVFQPEGPKTTHLTEELSIAEFRC